MQYRIFMSQKLNCGLRWFELFRVMKMCECVCVGGGGGGAVGRREGKGGYY